MQTEQRRRWAESHIITPDKKDLARHVLDLVRRGQDVTKTLRRHPLEDGSGYLNKSMPVAINSSSRLTSYSCSSLAPDILVTRTRIVRRSSYLAGRL
jgi:hypothetical protein